MFRMARGLAMAWGHCVALLPPLLLLLATLGLGQRPHPGPGVPGLWHSYDCGLKGMQLLVFPRQGQTIRFKVVGEYQLNPGPANLGCGGSQVLPPHSPTPPLPSPQGQEE